MLLFLGYSASACIQWANGRHPTLEVKPVSKIKLRANRMNKTHILGGVTAILFRLMYHVPFAVTVGFYVNEDNMRFVGRSKITDCQSYRLYFFMLESFILWPNQSKQLKGQGCADFIFNIAIHCLIWKNFKHFPIIHHPELLFSFSFNEN